MAILGRREADPSASVAGTAREAAFCGEGVAAGVAALAIVAAFGAGVGAEATVFAGAGVDGPLAAGVATGDFVSAILSPVAAFFPASPDGEALAAAVAVESFAAAAPPLAAASFAVRASGAGVAAEATVLAGAGVACVFAACAVADGISAATFLPSFGVGALAVVAAAVPSLPVRESAAGAGVAAEEATVLGAGVAAAFTVCPAVVADGVAALFSPEAIFFEDAVSFFAVDAAFPAPSLAFAAGSLEPESLVTMRGSAVAGAEVVGALGLVVTTAFSAGAVLFAAGVSPELPSSERSSGARALRNCSRLA